MAVKIRKIEILQFGCRLKSFSSNDWMERRARDPYVEKARQLAYRCRSAFKLIEINDKYSLIKPGQIVVDVGAAPGSWTQVLVNNTNAEGKDSKKPRGKVIAIDRNPMYPVEGATVLSGMDFTSKDSQRKIEELLGDKKFNFVFSDMAPNVTGVKALDQESMFNLAAAVLNFAVKNLHRRGGCLIKMFEGDKCNVVSKEMGRFFNHNHYVKPKATQTESSEIYLLATDFKGVRKLITAS